MRYQHVIQNRGTNNAIATRDELIKPENDQLAVHIERGNRLMKDVRQTTDAVMDSRFLVSAGELALKKTNNGVRGDAALSLDIDQFVSKCISFMRRGGLASEDSSSPHPPSSTQSRRRRTETTVIDDEEDSEDDEEDDYDGLNWSALGTHAAYPHNSRPPVPSFLLGPLSTQPSHRRTRQLTQRSARSQRQNLGPATKPQEINAADIQQSESKNLTHLVQSIKGVMERHILKGEEGVESSLEEEATEEDVLRECKRWRIGMDVQEGEAGVGLFDFVVNPWSFGQSVENLFYVSFLIKEGWVRVGGDVEGLPLLGMYSLFLTFPSSYSSLLFSF